MSKYRQEKNALVDLGVTLVELLAVVLILLILVVISFPNSTIPLKKARDVKDQRDEHIHVWKGLYDANKYNEDNKCN